MANINGFYQASRIGDEGEAIIQDWLIGRGYSVEDVSDDKEYDLIARRGTSKTKIEVKTDRKAHATGNLVVELINNKELHHDGWYNTSICDKFIFYLIKTNEYIIISNADLHDGFRHACRRIEETEQQDYGNVWKVGVIALLDISILSTYPSFRRGYIGG